MADSTSVAVTPTANRDEKLRKLRDRLSRRNRRDQSGLPLLRLETEMDWFTDNDVVSLIHSHVPDESLRRAFISCHQLDCCPIADRTPRGAHSLLVAMSGTHANGLERTPDSTAIPISDDLKPRLQTLGLDLGSITFLLVPQERYHELRDLSDPTERGAKLRRERLRELDPDADARTVFPRIVQRAAELGASDIHISPRRDSYTVGMRRKSILERVYTVPAKTGAALVNIIKTCALLDISEQRLPQDGRITLAQQPVEIVPAEFSERLKEISLRVSTAPTVIRERGEKVVLRLLRSGSSQHYDLGQLGLPEFALAELRNIVTSPHGMLLVTGPTGSGKTTTLYSLLAELNDGTLNICTAEDPVETRFDDMDQCQVNEVVGLTFARLLRSFLRQDPDVILVGEIRDKETADSAVQAARTGHLLLSTLHTVDSFTAFPRLRELGIGAPTLESCITAVFAQRLVRELCKECAETYDASAELNELLGGAIVAPGTFMLKRPPHTRDHYCQSCGNSGFTGMLPVVEVWVPSAAERHAMIYDQNVTHESLAELAGARGMLRMSEVAFDLVLAQRTTINEMLRAVVSPEEFRRDPLLERVKKHLHQVGKQGV